jgi:hypothetical protein
MTIHSRTQGELLAPAGTLQTDTSEVAVGFIHETTEIVEAHAWSVTVTENADGRARFEITTR